MQVPSLPCVIHRKILRVVKSDEDPPAISPNAPDPYTYTPMYVSSFSFSSSSICTCDRTLNFVVVCGTVGMQQLLTANYTF